MCLRELARALKLYFVFLYIVLQVRLLKRSICVLCFGTVAWVMMNYICLRIARSCSLYVLNSIRQLHLLALCQAHEVQQCRTSSERERYASEGILIFVSTAVKKLLFPETDTKLS